MAKAKSSRSLKSVRAKKTVKSRKNGVGDSNSISDGVYKTAIYAIIAIVLMTLVVEIRPSIPDAELTGEITVGKAFESKKIIKPEFLYKDSYNEFIDYSCNIDEQCEDHQYCHDAGVCKIKLSDGMSCVTDNQCISSSCVQGTCN